MNKKLFSFLITALIFLALPKSVHALDCAVEVIPDPDNPSLFDVVFCVGGAKTADVLSQIDVKVSCQQKSGGIGFIEDIRDGLGIDCKNVIAGKGNPTMTKTIYPPPADITTDDSGKYYTCGTVQQINPAAAEVDIKYTTKDGSCSTNSVKVEPYYYKGFMGFARYMNNTIATLTGILPEWEPGTRVLCADGKSVNTAIGCISFNNMANFTKSVVGVAIGLAGAITLILLLYGFFTLSTSAGNPDKVNAGKDVITSALGGLIFIVLSVILLKIIGVDILQLPGLSG